ncbi:hypothetical protein ACFO4O_03065 [Glaciecola siphonariae]|uniref:SGNH hydrolase-type esterase domain-containing protein n=1 Tax=Glaciecola siphonariae TaxID=521012 RepID=A0ABV9LT22_9ALTE
MNKANTRNKQTKVKPQANRRFAFYVIACAIPFVFFLLLEGGLRLIGFGKDVPLFIENPANPQYLLPRPDIMKRYFSDNAAQPNLSLEANFLLAQKPDNGLRIFVQGGSTAAGFPYGLGASLAATLDQRLKQTLPGRHVEVIGTALSAVNSYTLLDFADEIIAQQPDAVLIYAGHNEYLGILGVGSNFTFTGANRTTLWFLYLRQWRVFQLIQNLFFNANLLNGKLSTDESNAQNTLQDADAEHSANAHVKTSAEKMASSRTVMSQVAKHKRIEYQSEMFNAGIEQFARNMALLINKYKDAGIPVFIGTVASNQRDQTPFSSLPASPQHQALFDKMRATSLDNSTDSARKAALGEWQKTSSALISSQSAELHFKVAKHLEALSLYSLAKQHYMLAIEHDLLRFRAPAAINQHIEELSESSPDVYLVDTLEAFEQRSPHGIVGQNLMLEHLHPNLQGYFVLSESFYQSLKGSGLFQPWQNVPIEKAWQQRLVLPSEEYYAFATIQKLKSDYPFVDSPIALKLPAPADWQQELGKDLFEKQINWLFMMEESLKRYRAKNNADMTFKTLQILADALPHNGLYNVQVADIMYKQARLNEALHYYKRARMAGAVGKDIDNKIEGIRRRLNM